MKGLLGFLFRNSDFGSIDHLGLDLCNKLEHRFARAPGLIREVFRIWLIQYLANLDIAIDLIYRESLYTR